MKLRVWPSSGFARRMAARDQARPLGSTWVHAAHARCGAKAQEICAIDIDTAQSAQFWIAAG